MGLLAKLGLLFIGIPLLELLILIEVGQLIGLLPTIGMVVLTGAVGAVLARLEGLRTVWRIRADLARARLPADALFDGLGVLLGGALLLTPGILTDILGFSLILPPTRRVLMSRVKENMKGRLKAGTVRVGFFSPGNGQVEWPPPSSWPTDEGQVVNPEDEREPV